MPYLVDYTCLLFIFLAIPSPSSLIPKQPILDKLRMYDRPNFDQKLWELFKVEITDGIEVRGTRYRVGGNEGEREEGKDRKDDGGLPPYILIHRTMFPAFLHFLFPPSFLFPPYLLTPLPLSSALLTNSFVPISSDILHVLSNFAGCLLSGIFSAITFYDISGYISDKDYIFSDSGIGNSNLSYFENVALQREIEKEIDLDGNK
ncbi:unnamed protein product [Onchocerca flexuosa]|uniref:Rhomboid domain-containing protein n=1 Tax=Onchocerca flexuosa TaxID=387005 RepID=A0A183GXW1_9BILA|nr:unnamed protein product [Onchocerca flexuosa]